MGRNGVGCRRERVVSERVRERDLEGVNTISDMGMI